MAWIKLIDEGAATGLLARIYDAAIRRAGRVFEILKVQSNNPRTLKASMDIYSAAMFGLSPLSRVQREMLATVVSRANACHY
jgi:alkylhydroperoxidase family enzyme